MHRADRSTATVRNAYRIGRSMAGSSANVNDFLLGRDTGEGQDRSAPGVSRGPTRCAERVQVPWHGRGSGVLGARDGPYG